MSSLPRYTAPMTKPVTTTHLLREYQMTPGWTSHPLPVPAQIGGVARAEGPCPVDYVRPY
jgi:hypothetical protein